MTKKLLYIVIGGMFIFGVLFLLWTWFFSGGKNTGQNNGQFATSTDSSQNIVGGGGDTNGQANIGQNTTNGTLPVGSGGQNTGGGNTNGSTNGGGLNNAGSGNGTSSTVFSTANISGAQWLTTNANAGAGGSGFNPTAINGIDGASIGGTVPTIGSTVNIGGTGGSNSGINILLASSLIGVASCALQASGQTIGTLVGGGSTAVVGAVTGVPVNDTVTHASLGAQLGNTAVKNQITFAGCITNVLAKAALQQITASVVNWINGGFKGSPSFVTNYQQFFTNVADLAAGQFLQGAGLAFLCSPFKLQIKIAIAQSYANRGAQSCTLSKVINNVNGFMSGNFAQGGWPGLLSVTTVPTNNSYGAYAYAQIGLSNSQTFALANAKNNISPTGFLNLQQNTCTNTISPSITSGQNSQAAQVSCPPGCCKNTTPGSVIESTLNKTLGSGIDQLGLANSLDQIINALTTQLITKTLQGGLSNLSGTTGYQSNFQTPEQLAAQNQAQGILVTMQAQVGYAQQFGTIQQGSISDIETAQGALNNLINCWSNAASSTSLSSAQTSQAASNASNAQATFNSLNAQIDVFNNNITQVNAEIARLDQLQTEALSVASVADVQTLTNNYSSAQAVRPFIQATDVTTAQQNRTTLQTQMSALNISTQNGLQQCQAFGH